MPSEERTPPNFLDLDRLNGEIGDRVKALRNQRGWTQEELGSHVGLWVHGAGSQSTIAKLEAGSRSPRVIELYALAMIFGTPADELLGITPPKPTNPTALARDLVRALEKVESAAPYYYL